MYKFQFFSPFSRIRRRHLHVLLIRIIYGLSGAHTYYPIMQDYCTYMLCLPTALCLANFSLCNDAGCRVQHTQGLLLELWYITDVYNMYYSNSSTKINVCTPMT